jgi:hypothetical protein
MKTKRFIPTSYACRVGKGTHKALHQCHTRVRGYRYAFQGDIVKYFPSIYPTHRRLRRSSLRRFVRRFRRQREAYRRGEMTLEEMSTSVRSWIAHAEHGDTWR